MPPTNYKARPTTDFAKEGLFNTLLNMFDFEECDVLDLFGGTGSISFEFASRGCRSVTCVEMNQLHYNFIKRSAQEFKLDSMKVVRHNVFDFLEICRVKYDLIFADPPYDIAGLDTIPHKIFEKDILSDKGMLILEHPAAFDFSSNEHIIREKKYGNVHFSFFERKKV